jgi:hypothetical protein
LARFEKATAREEFLSSLHQAVVEVATLANSTSSLPIDLTRVTYSPQGLDAISKTVIELDETGKQIALSYDDRGKETIAEAAKKSARAKRHLPVSAAEGRSADATDSAFNDAFDTSVEEGLQDLPKEQAVSGLKESESYSMADAIEGFRDGNEVNYNDTTEDSNPKRRTPYAVTSPDFLSLPLESTKLRFSVRYQNASSLAMLI